jgi:hypothetical protein
MFVIIKREKGINNYSGVEKEITRKKASFFLFFYFFFIFFLFFDKKWKVCLITELISLADVSFRTPVKKLKLLFLVIVCKSDKQVGSSLLFNWQAKCSGASLLKTILWVTSMC